MARKATTCCHVGSDDSADDMMRTLEAAEWLLGRGVEPPRRHDKVNLNRGRDFLAESKTYEVVVLHFLFRGGFYVPPTTDGQLATSPLASWAAWRRRLVSTGAKYVFAYGGASEVGGTYLCDLPGYDVHKVRTNDAGVLSDDPSTHNGLWVFEKKEAA